MADLIRGDPRGNDYIAGRAACERGKVVTLAVTFEGIILGYQDDGNSWKHDLQRRADSGAFRMIGNDAGLYDGKRKDYLAFGQLVFNWHHPSGCENA